MRKNKMGRPKKYLDETEEERKQRKKEYNQRWYLENRRGGIPFIPLTKEELKKREKLSRKKYYDKNREQIREKAREDRRINPEKHRAYVRKYYEKNKEENKEKAAKRNLEMYHRRKHDPLFKLRKNIRQRLSCALRNNYKNSSALELTGCSMERLKKHLESLFEEGMTWENWNREGWHIDHIKPLSSFDLRKEEEQRKAMHYTNLQPLWAEENIKKGNKVDWQKNETST
jgi:hypothetical protein